MCTLGQNGWCVCDWLLASHLGDPDEVLGMVLAWHSLAVPGS